MWLLYNTYNEVTAYSKYRCLNECECPGERVDPQALIRHGQVEVLALLMTVSMYTSKGKRKGNLKHGSLINHPNVVHRRMCQD